MSKTDAEYMRAYRARKKSLDAMKTTIMEGYDAGVAAKRIAELEAEVKHLKAELAKRDTPQARTITRNGYAMRSVGPGAVVSDRFNSRPFTPAPKKGK